MRSFVTVLRCYIAYQRLWGIYPVAIRENRLEPLRALQIASAIASVALIIFAFTIKYETTDDGVLAVVVEAVSMLAMLGVAAGWISSALQTDKLCGAFQALHEADLLLKAHDIRPRLRNYAVAAWAWNIFFLICAVITLILEWFLPLWVLTGALRWALVQFYFTVLMMLITNFTFLQLTAAWRFRAINSKLRSMCQDVQKQSAVLNLPFSKSSKPLMTIAWEGCSAHLLKICEDLQKCHVLVNNACSDLLSVYSLPCFFSLGHATSELCCNIYKTLALPMVHQTSLNFIIVFNSCKWALLSLMRFVAIVGPLSYVASEGNGTLSLVLELQTQCNDPLVKRQLDNFALQLIRPLEFRPLALFTLDMGLLLGMLGTVATYVVILLQLHAAAPDIPAYVSE